MPPSSTANSLASTTKTTPRDAKNPPPMVISVGAPQLTFTTKIVGPLLKSRLLTPKDTIAVAASSRGMLISMNVQDPSILNLALRITRAETIAHLESYFALQKIELADPKKQRKSFMSRRISTKDPQSNRVASVGRDGIPETSNTTPTAFKQDVGKVKRRMTSWRFPTAVIVGREATEAFLTIITNDSSAAAIALRGTLQNLTFTDCDISLPKLTSLSRCLRNLSLLNTTGWDGGKVTGGLSLPIVKEITIKTTTQDWGLKSGALASIFPKVEILDVECPGSHDGDALTGLSDLRQYTFSCGSHGPAMINAQMIKLKDITVSNMNSTPELSSQVSELVKTATLNSKNFRGLSFLDANFITVPELSPSKDVQKLSLMRCKQLESVSGIEKLDGLVTVTMTGCTTLRDASLLNALPNLSVLNLTECDNLVKVGGLGQCKSLKVLNLSKCGALEDETVAELKECVKLQYLNVTGCGMIKSLETVAGPALRRLAAAKCGNLHMPPAMGDALDTVDMSNCVWLKDLSPLAKLPNLRVLVIPSCGRINTLAPLKACVRLMELDCSFSTLDGLGELTDACKSLELVTANAHDSITKLSECLPNSSPAASPLRRLRLGACRALRDLSPLGDRFGATLVEIDMFGSNIKECSAFAKCGVLTRLKLPQSRKLQDVWELVKCSNLYYLDVSDCEILEDVSGLGGSPSLTYLRVARCAQLKKMAGIENAAKLARVELSGSERGVFPEDENTKAVLKLEVRGTVVLYSKDEAMQWGGKSYEAIMAPPPVETKEGGGCSLG